MAARARTGTRYLLVSCPAVIRTALILGLALVSSATSAAAKPAVGTQFSVEASGDFLIHSQVYNRARANGGGRRYDFKPMLRVIKPVISAADIALCHQETPFWHGAPAGYPAFRTPPALASAIKWAGFDACSTASNHTLDIGQAGVNTTLRVLNKVGVKHAGSYRSKASSKKTTFLSARGVRVAFLAYTALTNGQRIPHPWTLNMAKASKIVHDARVARSRGADAVIVNLHWGTEYQHAPSALQRSLASKLTRSRYITAVVGQHVHVVQPIRWVHGKPVVFGEGNLLSGQVKPGTRDGLIAFLDLRAFTSGVRAVRVRYLPTYVKHPSYVVVKAGGRSRKRTIGYAGRSSRVVPIK
jgi:poly-gamma-glutamate capsule biosynthesis protein CapA/YwtB (metallophosphatase superfamily)